LTLDALPLHVLLNRFDVVAGASHHRDQVTHGGDLLDLLLDEHCMN
jgi:hypothetical protein